MDWQTVLAVATAATALYGAYTARRNTNSVVADLAVDMAGKSMALREKDIARLEKRVAKLERYVDYLWNWIERWSNTKRRPKSFDSFK